MSIRRSLRLSALSIFFDPVHAGLFELLGERMDRNSRVSPVTLKTFVDNVRGLSEVGGVEYLFKLAESAISVHASRDYAIEVYDLARRRELVALGKEISDRARKFEARKTVADLIHESEAQLYQLSETGQRGTGVPVFSEGHDGRRGPGVGRIEKKVRPRRDPNGFH